MYTQPAEKNELIFAWAYAVELFFESVEIKQHSLYCMIMTLSKKKETDSMFF